MARPLWISNLYLQRRHQSADRKYSIGFDQTMSRSSQYDAGKIFDPWSLCGLLLD